MPTRFSLSCGNGGIKVTVYDENFAVKLMFGVTVD
jgi:hypothetical protein